MIDWLTQDGIVGTLPVARIPGAQSPSGDAPHLGQHSLAVLGDWGVDAALVDELALRQVVRSAG